MPTRLFQLTRDLIAHAWPPLRALATSVRGIGLAFSLATVLAGSAVHGQSPGSSNGPTDSASLEQQILAGDLKLAVASAQSLVDTNHDQPDWSLVLARLARALKKAGERDSAANFYWQSVMASKRDSAKSLEPRNLALVRMAATSTLIEVERWSQAVDAMSLALTNPDVLSQPQQAVAVKLCLRIGRGALRIEDPKTAWKAYSLASQHGSSATQPTAMLGAAWAMASIGDQPLESGKRLAAFVEAYPDHADAPNAARVGANCFSQAGRQEDAEAMLADLLKRWPNSKSAIAVVNQQPDSPDKMAPAVKEWLTGENATKHLSSLDIQAVKRGAWLAAQGGDFEKLAAFTGQLAKADRSGKVAAALLNQLDDADRKSEAEQIAAGWIAPAGTSTKITPAAREAACRWAGRTQRWSMLALAAESESPDNADPSRTVTVERLFAEALTQRGEAAQAGIWWSHLVDQRGVDDFLTQLRCAESETSVGSDAAVAGDRIQAARTAAGDHPFRRTLVDLLDAQLAIRRLKFGRAREILLRIVSDEATDRQLRCRARFLIGETYYLQQDFAQAIESYRKVEGIDSNSEWVAASLVQAGKSFEQLGRTRAATVCYLGLVNRFPASPHVAAANRRLAALSPSPPDGRQSPQPTLKR